MFLRFMQYTGCWFASLLISLILGGCASSSKSVREAVTVPKTIAVTSVKGEASQFIEQFYAPFEARGFHFGETDDPNAAKFTLSFDPNVFHTEFKVSLIQNGRVLLESAASNSGWGTGIARPQALARLADEVTKNIEKELSELRFSISNDVNLAANVCADLVNGADLNLIRDKVDLSASKIPPFKFLVNTSRPNDAEVEAIMVWASRQKKCLDASLSSIDGSSNMAKADALVADFNDLQAITAQLATKQLTYGDFAKKVGDLNISKMKSRADREALARSNLEREKDRGTNATNQTQQIFQGGAAITKPTFTRCNRIGTQVFCNSY